MPTRKLARLSLPAVFAVSLLGLLGCPPKTPAPLGPHSFTFYGSTKDQNHFNKGPAGGDGAGGGIPAGGIDPPFTLLKVMMVAVDVNDHRFSGTPADRTAWRNARLTDYQAQVNPFWLENSYGSVGEALAMRDEIFPLKGAFDDYFNRDYVPAALVTSGLAAAVFPLNVTGASAVIHVRDLHDRNDDVTFAPGGTVADANGLVVPCQTAFDAVRPNWVACTNQAGELRMQLVDAEIKEGSFLRVKSGTNLKTLGMDGPDEEPGNGAPASLTGKPVPGGFPLTIANPVVVQLEVRNKDLVTRRYTITVPAGTIASGTALAAIFPPPANAEFNWVEANAKADRLGLRVAAAQSGPNAAIRVVGGAHLEEIGLDGPKRDDGVIDFDNRNTVRTDDVVGEALSLFLAKRAAEAGVAIAAGNETAIQGVIDASMSSFDSFMVLFVDDHTGIPGKRAAANSSVYWNLSIPGANGYTYVKQIHSGIMIGTGADAWTTWAHESGHVLGFWDLYDHSTDDPKFVRPFSYMSVWSLMDTQPPAEHVEGWHKNMRTWLATPAEVDPPPSGATETHGFTLVPLEFPLSDYPGVGDANHPPQQLVRVKLSENHWIQIENRGPGTAYSQQLPDMGTGTFPPAGPMRGGILVSDTVDPWAPFNFRPPVSVLNPRGVSVGRGLRQGENLDLKTTFPAYDGIQIHVVDTFPGPAGKPPALAVEVERGPGDFLELGMRPWQAPNVYATPDIWIDWPGNGAEDYPTSDPPVGSSDPVHWDPDGKILNYIKVRVHNSGTVDGKGVVVRLSVNTPMGMGDHGTFVPLPDSAPQDVPAGGFHDFVFEWYPTGHGHTCLLAQIVTHATALSDLDLTNNQTQENIDDFSPSSASPYPPTDFTFTVNSRYDRPMKVRLNPTGLVDGMDLEVEAPVFVVPANGTIKLKGRLKLDVAKIPPNHKERRLPLRFNLHALRATRDAWLPYGGISVDVNPGYTSSLKLGEVRKAERGIVIEGVLKGPFPSGQKIDAAIVARDGKSYGGTAVTSASGVFQITVVGPPRGPARAMLYYFGPDMAYSTVGPQAIVVP